MCDYLKCMAVSSNLDAAKTICESLAILSLFLSILFHSITSKLESFGRKKEVKNVKETLVVSSTKRRYTCMHVQ